MNQFEYVLVCDSINKLTTTKDKKAMLTKLLVREDFYSFKALTYLIKKYPSINPGLQIGERIKYKLVRLLEDRTHNVSDITEFCNSDFEVSEFHYEKLATSRYTTFQMLAYISKHIKITTKKK